MYVYVCIYIYIYVNIDKCVCVYVWRHMVVTSDAIWSVNIFIYIYIYVGGGFMPTVCFIHAHIESSQIGPTCCCFLWPGHRTCKSLKTWPQRETPNSPLVPVLVSDGTGRALGGKGGSRRPGQVFEEKVEHLSAKMRKFHKHIYVTLPKAFEGRCHDCM